MKKNRSKKINFEGYAARFGRKRYAKWIIALVFFAIVFFLTFIKVVPQRYDLKEGDVVQENIVAPRRIVDTKMTDALRDQAENMTSPVYDFITSAYTQATDQGKNLFDTLSALQISALNEAAVASYNQILGVRLTLEEYTYLAELPEAQRGLLSSALLRILQQTYSGEVKADALDAAKEAALARVDEYDFSSRDKQILKKILPDFIRPNMILNEEATEAAKKNARDSVYEVVYEAGQTIVKRGDVITAHQISLLRDSGLIRAGLFEDLSTAVGLPLLLFVLVALFISYLFFYHKEIFNNNKLLILIASQFVLMLLIGQICGNFSVYLIPVSILTMSLCLLFSSRLAVQTNLFLMLFLAVTLQLDIDSFLYLAVSGYMGIVYMRQVSSRTDIFKSGLLVSAGNALMIVILSVLRSNVRFGMLNDVVYGVGNGIIAALLTTGTLMIWEALFNVLTPFKLLEMSSPNDYVIQKLIADAPGTYHHSLVVSNMAESAAKNIGANTLLARVGAYYHDIGKAEKAVYFKENQNNITNPHDFIAPEVSVKIIKNHVSDGIYLAEKHRIPEEIIDFIRTHHGTSEITFFKVKAEENGYEGDEDFHYHGALPSTKETSIVMLADSIEAAVRSLDSPETEKIRQMVGRIVGKKMTEGQLEASPLSFAEIEVVKKTFTEVLTGVYHNRVKYPGQEKDKEVKS